MANSRLAVLLDWTADPFCFFEQTRTAWRFAQSFGHDELVFALDFTPPDKEAPPFSVSGVHAIDETRTAAARAQLGATAPPRTDLTTRAIIYETTARALLDQRYRRIDPPDAPGDAGAQSAWSIPRDGAIDLKDANFWLLPDWISERMVYPVRPTATTYHPIADILTVTPTPNAAFTKRMRYSEAAYIACPAQDADMAAKRFGVSPGRVAPWPAPSARPDADDRRLLVLTASTKETKAAADAIEREASRRADTPIAAVIAEIDGAGPMGVLRTMQLDTAAKRKNWSDRKTHTPLASVKTLLANANAIAVVAEAAPRAFAIANWVEEGRLVSFHTDLPPRAFERWPNARPSAKADAASIIRLARTAPARAP